MEERENVWAFPYVVPGSFQHIAPGMTLRDYFATKAIQALIGNLSVEGNVVSNAYWIADRIMEERDK